MGFELGCKWTVEYFLSGMAGSLLAVLTLPGCYTSLPRLLAIEGEQRIYWGVIARLVVGGITGCLVDCNSRNALFGGFFSWHIWRWMQDDGWKILRTMLQKAMKSLL